MACAGHDRSAITQIGSGWGNRAAQGSREGRYREYRPDRGRSDATILGRSAEPTAVTTNRTFGRAWAWNQSTRSVCGPPAVDHQIRAADVRRLVGQEGDSGRDVLGAPQP